MKTQLIMLDTPIIVSDEEIRDGDFYLWDNNQNGAPSLCTDSYSIKESKETNFYKVIAGIEGLPSIDWNGLEEELGWVDVDYIIKSVCGYDKNVPLPDNDNEVEVAREVIKHFKKAQSLNDKKFSLEDIKKALQESFADSYCEDGTLAGKSPADAYRWIDNYIQSLQQPKVFDIEVEMEEYDHDEDWSEISGAFEICKYRPKITNNSIKIIRKL